MHALQGYDDAEVGNRRELSLLTAILILALASRLMAMLLARSWVFSRANNFWEFGYEMGQIATSIAQGNGFSWPDWSAYPPGPTAWMPPVYPYIMAGVFKLFGRYSEQSAIALQLFQTTLSTLSCFFLYLIGKHLYSGSVGLLTAFLFALYPPSIHYAIRYIWGTSLFVCLFLLITLLFLQQTNRPEPRAAVWFGIVLGFTALVDPIIIGVYPFALMWLYLKFSSDNRIITHTLLPLLISCLIVVTPWIIRNYLVFGKFIPIKSNSGRELFIGNNKSSVGNYEDAISNLRKGENPLSSLTESDLVYLERSNEIDRNSFLSRKAIQFIREYPMSFVHRTLNRFLLYWTYIRPVDNLQQKISLMTYYFIAILAVIGIVVSLLKHIDIRLLLLLLITFPLPYYFTVVGVFRYRYPIEPILIVFAAYALYTTLSLWMRNSQKEPLPSC